jgi:hypothetical protein
LREKFNCAREYQGIQNSDSYYDKLVSVLKDIKLGQYHQATNLETNRNFYNEFWESMAQKDLVNLPKTSFAQGDVN